MAATTTAAASFASFFIFGVGCSWRGAVGNGGSWAGCVDNGRSCGVVLKLSNRFFGALAGARFFFGFRPRLLGIGKQYLGTDQVGRSPETYMHEYGDARLLLRIVRSGVHERAMRRRCSRCCARAASGHAAAPRSVMKSQRLIRALGSLRPEHALGTPR
jgi:hypothetical protein